MTVGRLDQFSKVHNGIFASDNWIVALYLLRFSAVSAQYAFAIVDDKDAKLEMLCMLVEWHWSVFGSVETHDGDDGVDWMVNTAAAADEDDEDIGVGQRCTSVGDSYSPDRSSVPDEVTEAVLV